MCTECIKKCTICLKIYTNLGANQRNIKKMTDENKTVLCTILFQNKQTIRLPSLYNIKVQLYKSKKSADISVI